MAEKPTSRIREKFGMDYLIPESKSAAAASDSAADTVEVDRALAAFGRRILEFLNSAAEKRARMFDIVDATGIEAPKLQLVLDRMARSQIVEIEGADKYGNNVVALTPTGEKSL